MRCLFKESYGKEDQGDGELTPEGIAMMLKSMPHGVGLAEDDTIFDLGAGSGRAIMHLFLTSPVRQAVGIEISDAHYTQGQQALVALQRLSLDAGQEANLDADTSRASFTLKGRELKLEKGDLLTAANLEEATVVLANVDFSEALTDSVTKLLVSTCRPGTLVVLMTKLEGCPRGLQMLTKTELNDGIAAYLYVVTTPAEEAETMASKELNLIQKVPEGKWGSKATQLRRLRTIMSETASDIGFHRDRGSYRSAVQCDAMNVVAAYMSGGSDRAEAVIDNSDLLRKDDQNYDMLRYLIEAQSEASKVKTVETKERAEKLMKLVNQMVQAIAAIRFPKPGKSRTKGKKNTEL